MSTPPIFTSSRSALGVDDDVGAVDGQLFVDAVADGGGEGEHGGDGGCSEQDGESGESLAATLAAEAFHRRRKNISVATSSLEDRGQGAEVGRLNDDLAAADGGLQRDRVAAARLAHRLRHPAERRTSCR